MTLATDTREPVAGLSDSEVASRVAAGKVNHPPENLERTLGHIIRTNVFTTVNAIMIVLFVLVVVAGYWKDGLFVGVVFSNSVIGVAQEVRARRELARLEVVTEPTARVVREGTEVEIDTTEIVLDEVLHIETGGQIAVDAEVLDGTGLQLDESMLTGEADAVKKKPGDEVLSGSFVVAGSGLVRATAVGADSYANTLTTEAKTFSTAESHLRRSVDRILRWLTFIIPVASIMLLISLLDAEDRWQDALQGTVAAAVAMVPDGLVLLTSLAFVAGVLELSKRKALAKQLSSVEVLARVDVLCLDKTGTITTGEIRYAGLHPLADGDESETEAALGALAHSDEAPNNTMGAIRDGVQAPVGWTATEVEPFSSKRKWSAMEFGDHGWFFIGGPDMLLPAGHAAHDKVSELSQAGQRLLLMASADVGPRGDELPADITPVAIVELQDEIRPDANDILAYFRDQDVTVKVISGDNHETVAAIAERAGLEAQGSAVDARELPSDEPGLSKALEAGDVFGRVAPKQKQDMVHALQSQGHVVAMTGDGVNDVLALKDADLGIAMGSGSAATRTVADLVLTDDSFATLPVVVSEGRKVINNVERVANLFVTKAVYAVLITLAIGIAGSPFPFLPRQLTLIGTFSIGVPGFFLALNPEVTRVRHGFLNRVLRFSVPSGIIAGTATFIAYEITRGPGDLTTDQARTIATLTMLTIGLVILVVASRPLRPWKVAVAGSMALGYAIIASIDPIRRYFQLEIFNGWQWGVSAACAAVAGVLIALVPRLTPGLDGHEDHATQGELRPRTVDLTD